MFTTNARTAGPDPLPSDTRRAKTMLAGLTKVKLPACTEADERIVAASAVERAGTGKRKGVEYPPADPPGSSTSRTARRADSRKPTGRSTGRRSGAGTARSGGQRSGRSTARSVVSSAGSEASSNRMNSLTREKEQLEDQLWDVSHKAEWLKAQTGLRASVLSKTASPDRWLTNGAKMFMANRYKTTSMTDFMGYHGTDVFADSVTDTSNRRIKGQAAKYGNRLSGAKITLRGNF